MARGTVFLHKKSEGNIDLLVKLYYYMLCYQGEEWACLELDEILPESGFWNAFVPTGAKSLGNRVKRRYGRKEP